MKEAPVNTGLPPKDEVYQLNVGEATVEEAVSVVVDPEQIVVVPETPLIVGTGYTVATTGVLVADSQFVMKSTLAT